MRTRTVSRLPIVLVLAAVACGRGDDAATTDTANPPATANAAVRVTEVTVGNAIGADKRVTAAMDELRPSDTIYVSVATEGSASNAQLTARWTFEDGQVVDETSQTISPTGPAVTEFHISNPAGWPPGDYEVEILLDGASAERKSFSIR